MTQLHTNVILFIITFVTAIICLSKPNCRYPNEDGVGCMKEEDRNIVVGALRACSNKKALENVFIKFDIGTAFLEERRELLLEAMGNPQMFFSIGEPSLEQRYELTIQMFLSMSWKYSLMRKGMHF